MQDDESAISHTRLSYLPALDGVRACAVVAVMMFHGGIPHMDGGFMGVDAFFVLSGFLITSLLVGEWRQSLTIKLGAFWARRARRLLPALLLMLLFVAFLASVIVPKGTYGALRLDALATLLYVSNWHFILVNSNYFNETAASSPLLHTWSLAVEEQFYVIWPLVVLGVLHVTRNLRALFAPLLCRRRRVGDLDVRALRRRRSTRTGCTWAPTPDPSACSSGAPSPSGSSCSRSAVTRTAAWPRGSCGSRRAARGGPLRRPGRGRRDRRRHDLGADLLDVLVPLLGRVLPHRPVGRRRHPVRRRRTPQHRPSPSCRCRRCATSGASPYGLYIWHWPIFIWLDHARTGLLGYELFAVRVLVTFAVSVASLPPRRAPHPHGHLRHASGGRGWWFPPASVSCLSRSWPPPPGTTALATTAFGSALGTTSSSTTTTAPAAVRYGPARAGAALRGLGCPHAGSGPGLHRQQRRIRLHPRRQGHLGLRRRRRPRGRVARGACDGTPSACNGSPLVAGEPLNDQPWPVPVAPAMNETQPNVVVLLAGRWEVVDREYRGTWTNILNPTFAAYVKRQLEMASQLVTATGARMVFLTAPCTDSGEQPDGAPWPEDSPARLAEYNKLIREVAADHAQTDSVVDLDAAACPGGKFTSTVDGDVIRNPDGIHFSPIGGQVLAPKIMPAIVAAGRAQAAAAQGTSAGG